MRWQRRCRWVAGDDALAVVLPVLGQWLKHSAPKRAPWRRTSDRPENREKESAYLSLDRQQMPTRVGKKTRETLAPLPVETGVEMRSGVRVSVSGKVAAVCDVSVRCLLGVELRCALFELNHTKARC